MKYDTKSMPYNIRSHVIEWLQVLETTSFTLFNVTFNVLRGWYTKLVMQMKVNKNLILLIEGCNRSPVSCRKRVLLSAISLHRPRPSNSLLTFQPEKILKTYSWFDLNIN